MWHHIDGVPGLNGAVHALTFWDPDGPGPRPQILVAGGAFSVAGETLASNIAVWNGTAWSALGAGIEVTNVSSAGVTALLALPNGDLVVGGDFLAAGGTPAAHIARWDGNQWSALAGGLTGVGSVAVNALALMPNGDLVAGGLFSAAGGSSASCIARWNGLNWSPLGAGITGIGSAVNALAVTPTGDLVAAGIFSSAGGNPAGGIAHWNGQSWTALGSGTTSPIYAVGVLPNGDTIAGGAFSSIGTVAARGVARWNGTTWSGIGSGTAQTVFALAVLPNGQIFAAGRFLGNWGVGANNIARWNGSAWVSLGLGLTSVNGPPATSVDVFTVAVDASGHLFAGGNFTTAGATTADAVAQWDGATWSTLGTGFGVNAPSSSLGSYVSAVVPRTDGSMYVAGDFLIARVPTRCVALRVGETWVSLGGGTNSAVYTMVSMPNSDIVVGGDFTVAGSVSANRVARWNGTGWSALGAGVNGRVFALAPMPNGDVVAGGFFSMAGTRQVNNIARWNGATWLPLGAGVNSTVDALQIMPNGDLIAGGLFSAAGGGPASYVARWNGATWSPLGGGLSYTVNALAVLPNGVLVAGCSASPGLAGAGPRLAAWNGSTWTNLGAAPATCAVYSLKSLPDGDLIVGGTGLAPVAGDAGNYLAKWGASGWRSLAGGVGITFPSAHVPPAVSAIAHLSDGALVVGGNFSLAGGRPANRLARFGSGSSPADFNSDGFVNPDDLSDYITCFFLDIQFPASCPASDFNADGITNPDDLSDFINAYFNGCGG